jgi:hypothetical protein
MKTVVSVSLGSSKRDHKVETSFLGEDFLIERRGTDGDFNKALALLKELDGKVDAIGLGGVDVYIYSRKQRYSLGDGLKLMHQVSKTPVADGSGLKNTLERKVVESLRSQPFINLKDLKVLMVCAMDRFGMAEALEESGCKMLYGDLIFILEIEKPLHTVEALDSYAERLLPEITKLPFELLYPTGAKQEKTSDRKFDKYYLGADLIAGDYLLIKRFMPASLEGKYILTNTVTQSDIEDLKQRGVSYLVTTTPEFSGRSFGTNVLQAVFLALLGKKEEEVKPEEYLKLIEELQLKPRIEKLN